MDYRCNNRYSQNGQQNARMQCGSTTNDMPIGMCYVPWQKWGNIYDPYKALCRGTVFADLDKPFLGGNC